MAILLGKDAFVSVGGAVAGVRNVTWSESARTIDVEEYGTRQKTVYSTGYDTTVSMELIDTDAASGLAAAFLAGTQIQISGGGGNWSFTGVLTSIQETDSLDGVATFLVEAKLTRPGLKL